MAGLIRRAPLAFFSFLEELLQEPADETHDKRDDILLFMMLEEFMKNCRNAEVRTESYVERIVPAMSDSSFRQHFRLSRPTAQRLVNILGTCPEIPVPREKGRPTVEIEKQLLITVWYLGNPECIRSVSDRFDVSRSTVLRITTRICNALVNNIAPHFIQWPSGDKLIRTIEGFNENNGLLRCIGAIDGTHIPIKAPHNHHEHYINRKGFHSMQLQVVCDTDMIFTDVYCGWPGAAHDARVLRNSPLFHDAETRTNDIFPGQTYIIGDAAYPLKTWLMTGFKDNGHLTARQKRFTKRLSSKRMVIERGIGLLKGRFRKLKVMVDIDRIRFLPKLVIAACTLHNFCIYSNDEIDDFLQPLDDDDDANNFVNIFADDNNAVRKRAEIMDMIC